MNDLDTICEHNIDYWYCNLSHENIGECEYQKSYGYEYIFCNKRLNKYHGLKR